MFKKTRFPTQIPCKRLGLPLWLTVNETAALLKVSTTTVYEWCRQDKLPVFKIDNTIRVDRDGLFWQARGKVHKSIPDLWLSPGKKASNMFAQKEG